MFISVFTGFVAGALHVVGGADHLVAMAPTAFRRPRLAFKNGLAWGVGHSTGVLVLSCMAILAKDLINIQAMSSFAEFLIGISLLIIGVLTIKTAMGVNIHSHNHKHEIGNHEHVHFHIYGKKRHKNHSHTAASLGILHGLAGGSHLIAVIPALALPPLGAITYMTSYLLGSVVAMAAFVFAMSLATFKAGQKALPLVIAFTGILSITTGFFWLQKTSNLIL